MDFFQILSSLRPYTADRKLKSKKKRTNQNNKGSQTKQGTKTKEINNNEKKLGLNNENL